MTGAKFEGEMKLAGADTDVDSLEFSRSHPRVATENQSPECPVWILPAGSLLHIGGMPYFTTEPTKVEGYGDPIARLKPTPLTGDEESKPPKAKAAGQAGVF